MPVSLAASPPDAMSASQTVSVAASLPSSLPASQPEPTPPCPDGAGDIHYMNEPTCTDSIPEPPELTDEEKNPCAGAILLALHRRDGCWQNSRPWVYFQVLIPTMYHPIGKASHYGELRHLENFTEGNQTSFRNQILFGFILCLFAPRK